jgi:orotidine-5'-phosphate decarboxylase
MRKDAAGLAQFVGPDLVFRHDYSPRSALCYTTGTMTVPFQKRFVALAAVRSALCVGIDPSAETLKAWGLPDDALGLRSFCDRMVEVCAPLVACVKPQSAFFERHGAAGMDVLYDTVEAAHSHGTLVIIDAKRGDIDSTAAAYGEAFLGPKSPFGGDAMTLTAYFGFGSLAPIVERAYREGAGLFVMVRSSNPEGTELQHARMPDGHSVAERLADQITARNAADGTGELGLIGAVVGATLGGEAADIAARLPNSLLLVPGIGAQGATIADARGNFGVHYSRVIPSLSRAIARAGPDSRDLRREVERRIAEARGVE